MLDTDTYHPDTTSEIALRHRIEHLEADIASLRDENAHLRQALDAHIARIGSTRVFGLVELTAGTSVGPRRRRAASLVSASDTAVGSAGGAHAARRSRLALVSSRRHLAPCVRFSLTRRTDILHLVAFAAP